jgi:tripartite-type tricarboxylate transporter receptor subunit TctC
MVHIIRLPLVMVVNPSVPAKTVPEFTAYAKANPGKINLGSPGIGSSPHVAGELFKMMAGVDSEGKEHFCDRHHSMEAHRGARFRES